MATHDSSPESGEGLRENEIFSCEHHHGAQFCQMNQMPPPFDAGENHCKEQTTRGLVAGVCLTLFLMTGCSGLDPEYSQKLSATHTDSTGNEVAGVWVTKFSNAQRYTLLLRPDGTGRLKGKVLSIHPEWDVTWRYVGGGRWEGRAKVAVWQGAFSGPDYDLGMRFTGKELLVQGINDKGMVFVSADDEMAVEQHLRAR